MNGRADALIKKSIDRSIKDMMELCNLIQPKTIYELIGKKIKRFCPLATVNYYIFVIKTGFKLLLFV